MKSRLHAGTINFEEMESKEGNKKIVHDQNGARVSKNDKSIFVVKRIFFI